MHLGVCLRPSICLCLSLWLSLALLLSRSLNLSWYVCVSRSLGLAVHVLLFRCLSIVHLRLCFINRYVRVTIYICVRLIVSLHPPSQCFQYVYVRSLISVPVIVTVCSSISLTPLRTESKTAQLALSSCRCLRRPPTHRRHHRPRHRRRRRHHRRRRRILRR